MTAQLHRRPQRHAALLLGATIASFAFTSVGVHAGQSSGCLAARSGALNVNVASAGTATRQVTLDAGDVLNFTARSDAAASVSLISGPGSPQALVRGTAAGSFRAPETGTYVFGMSAGSRDSVQVSAACISAQTAAANAAFLARRQGLLSAKDPDRIRIDRKPTPIANPDQPLASSVAVDAQGNPTQVQFSVSLSEIQAAANPGRKPEPGFVDLWLEGRMENYNAGHGNLGVVYLGTRTKLGPDILVGGLAQFDRGIESPEYADSQMATGWMAGPYMSMKLGSGVVFDGRAAWGATENVLPGLTLDNSETERRLVRAKLTGTRQLEGWQLAPSLGLVYVEDAVRDGDTGETKAEGTGRVELLPQISRRFDVNSDTFVEPRAAVGGFVGFDDLGALESSVVTGDDSDLHLKAEAGLALGVKDGSRLEATGGVESAGATTPENWTGRLQLNVPLGK